MPKTTYWADNYVQKLTSAEQALQCIQPGQRVFIGSSCGEPQHLVKKLAEASVRFTDLEIVRLLCIESGPLTLVANRSHSQQFNIRSFYLGSGSPKKIYQNKRFNTPINLSQIPHLFKSRMMPINAALIQASPPDDFGWMSLGVSVDITLAACESADIVICQINPNMPRVLGRSFIHVNDVDYIVEHEEDLLTIHPLPELETANIIAKHISRLIDDGSTLQTKKMIWVSILNIYQTDRCGFSPWGLSPIRKKDLTTENLWRGVLSDQIFFMNLLTITPALNFIRQIISITRLLLPDIMP